MKTTNLSQMLVLIFLIMTLLAISVNAQVGTISAPMPNWENGALNALGDPATPLDTGAVKVFNEGGNVVFRNSANAIIGKTNGAADNGVAKNAFKFKFAGFNGALPWQNTVPFAFGERGGRNTLWTPQFNSGSPKSVYMGQFVTDNSPEDEDTALGIIEVGEYRAVDGDINFPNSCNTINPPTPNNRVCFQKWDGASWKQIGRTNGAGDNGDLKSFTVLQVRTGTTVGISGTVESIQEESVPIAYIENPQKIQRLQTPNYGNNIGTQIMFQFNIVCQNVPI